MAGDKKDRNKGEEFEDFTPVPLPKERGLAVRRNDSKKIRKISPLGMRVLVRLQKDDNQTEGGLYLPEGAKQSMEESLLAEVMEVASAIDDSTYEEANISGVPLGACVLIPKRAGTKVPWDDALRIVETKEILAIVHEVDLS